jgi:Na(+)-translocating NADH:ubiquinone oxidoreductase F subunit
MVRDYSLVGAESQKVIDMGLTDAEWYQSPVPREKIRELLERKNGPAIRDTLIWFGLIFGTGYLVFIWWGSWLAVLPYIVYSALYASTSDSRWHESSHGTAFKADWMNNTLYEIASFMVFRQSTVWRYSHTRHHSDTIIRGRDPEIAVPRPPKLRNILLKFVGFRSFTRESKKILTYAIGKIDPEVATYLPKHEYASVILKARVFIVIYAFVIGLSVYFKSMLPLMYIGLPTFLGGWLMHIYALTQHAGLQENVLDHRLNCRTVYMNPIHRYLYWNMNYHVEHHMFPLVPYHALPRLHELIKDDCPAPYRSIYDAFREIVPTILRQRKDPSYYVERILPEKSRKGKSSDFQKKIFRGDASKMNPGKIEVCQSNQLGLGEVVRFDCGQKTYAVYRTRNDAMYATDGICTHGNAHLADGFIIGDVIECSKHNGRFSLRDGSPKRTPVCIGLKTFKVELEGDKIIIDLSDDGNIQQKEEEKERTFRVVSNRNVATFIKELELEPLNHEKFIFQPGQYIQLVIPPHKTRFVDFQIDDPYRKTWEKMNLMEFWSENSTYSKRNYSLATNPAKEKRLKFNIRIALPAQGNAQIAGVGSSYVYGLKSGDEVSLTGPFGNFQMRKSDREKIFLGKGAGMAPLRSQISYLFENGQTKEKVSFWYGAHALDDVFYDDYFKKLEDENQNFSFHLSLSQSSNVENWNGYLGQIQDVLLAEYLSGHEDPGNIDYYLCGSPGMIKAALKMLHDLGVEDGMILFDEF